MKKFFLPTLLLATLICPKARSQNIVDTYNKECSHTFAGLVDKNEHSFRFIHALDLKNKKNVARLNPIERHAYRVYKEKKLYNYAAPGMTDQVRIGFSQYVNKRTDLLKGYRIDFIFGKSPAHRIRMYYVVNNQRNQLLHIRIDQPVQKSFWVCQGFAAVPSKGDTYLYTLAKQAGPFFDYPATEYQFNVQEITNIDRLPHPILKIGQSYKVNQTKLRPHIKFVWAHHQHIVTIDGHPVGYVLGFNFHQHGNLLEGGGVFLFVNRQGKIIAERSWHQ